jgi:2-oxoisovalerate dehydrogenase E1 component alpha subunit
MNFAGVWKLPVLFVVNNNQWAISVPLSRQTAAQTLAQKAIAAGFSGEQVDGNDAIAVRASVDAAISAAAARGSTSGAKHGGSLLSLSDSRARDGLDQKLL